MGRKTTVERMTIKQIVKELTPDQRKFLDLVKQGRKDPVFFAEVLLDIKLHDAQKVWLWMTTRRQLEQAYTVGLTLNDEHRSLWKTREEFDNLLKKNQDSQKNILVPSNRWGKTLVTSVKHIWYNYYKIGVRAEPDQWGKVRCGTMNLSPHSNQCQAGYEYIMDILFSKFVYTIDGKSYRNSCKIEDFYVSDNSQKRTIHFKNGTFYKAVPTGEDQASSLAGNPYLYISYDECAQSLHLKAELPAKIMSRLIDFGGALDLVSTPEVDKPSHQYFYHIAKLGLKGDEGWWTMVGKLTDNVFLGSKEVHQVIDAIRTTDPMKYRQVAFGEFITTGKKMFDAIVIERMWDGFNPEYPKLGRKYLVWADWGFSDTGDPTVFYVFDYTDLLDTKIPEHLRMVRIAYREAIRGGSPFAVLARAKMLQREWQDALFGHDSSSMGGVIIKKMLREMDMRNIVDFSSAGGQKQDMLFCLVMLLSRNRKAEFQEDGKVIERNPDFGGIRSYYIPELEEQMGNYQYNPDKGVTDKRLEQDDVMCLGMGIWYLTRKIMKSAVKMIDFNPLAPSVGTIFSEKAAQTLSMHTITIPEKRIF